MAEKDLILSIDNGTQSLKALVFDLQGNLLAKKAWPFTPYFSAQPGWAEQDPEVFWDVLCKACQSIFSENPGLSPRLACAALTTQRATVINLDKSGKPLRPAMLWLDRRRTGGLLPLGGWWGVLFKVLGLRKTIAYFMAEAEANWIRTYQPEVWKKTSKYLLLSGYLTYRLIGEAVDSVGCQVGYIPFDFKRLKWANKRNWKWECIKIHPRMLPDLRHPGQVLGEITASASRQTGIPKGLPLVAAAADKACEVIGSGSLTPDIGCLSYSTTATINVTSKKYVEPLPLIPPYPAAVPGYYTMEVEIYRGYWMVSWFKEEFGHPEMAEAEKNGLAVEELFENLVKEVPPGSMGLMLQPYWSPGIKNPGPEAKGAIIGFGDIHTRSYIYRSILEGLAYALREGKERIEKKTRIPITSLRVSGGGSQSPSAMQLTADIFGLPTARPHLYETSGLGAAVSASIGLALHPGIAEAVSAMTRVGEVYEPDPKTHRLYDALYKDVYMEMYKRLKPLYDRIRKITGYPF